MCEDFIFTNEIYIGQCLSSEAFLKIMSECAARDYYFGGARSKGFATLRNISKLTFFGKIGRAKSVGFRFYSGI